MSPPVGHPRPLRAPSVRPKRARAISAPKKRASPSLIKRRKAICFSDFDGTIFMQDTGHVLFDKYGCGSRRRKVLDGQIKSGKRGFKDVSEEMWSSLQVSFDAAIQTLKRSLQIDQDFTAFHSFCSSNEVPFGVISAGLKPVLKQVLNEFLGEEKATTIEIISNDALIEEDGSNWKPIWCHGCELGHNKEQSINEYRQKSRLEDPKDVEPLVVFIGDGASDLPAARAADVLFARKGLELEKHCLENDLSYIPYNTFADIQVVVECVLKDIQVTEAGHNLPEVVRSWRRVSHRNQVSFAGTRVQRQTAEMIRTLKEAAAPAA